MPTTVISTAEYDYLRRDAIALRNKLDKFGVPTDWHEMPGVGSLYHYDCNYPQSYWFFKDYSHAFEKYVKKDDELQQLAASFKKSAKSIQI